MRIFIVEVEEVTNDLVDYIPEKVWTFIGLGILFTIAWYMLLAGLEIQGPDTALLWIWVTTFILVYWKVALLLLQLYCIIWVIGWIPRGLEYFWVWWLTL